MNQFNREKKPPLKKVLPPRRTSTVPGVLVIAVLCLLLFASLILLLYQNDMIVLPRFLSALIGKPETEPSSPENDFTSAFLGALDTQETTTSEQNTGSVFTIDRETLEQYVSAGGSENYYHEAVVTYPNDETIRVKKISIFRSGEKYKIHITHGDESEKTVICDGTQLLLQNTVQEQSTRKILPLSAEEGFSVYSEAGIPCTQDLFDLLDAAESGEVIADYTIELLRESDRNAASITFLYPDTGIREMYEIDLESTILVRAESTLQDTMYYSMATSVLSIDILSGTGLFKIES